MKSYMWMLCGLAATTLAFELPQNALCGDNVDCANRCSGGRFHIVNDKENDSMYFGCSVEGTRNYRVFNCQSPTGNNFRLRNATATQLACDAAAGRLCDQCVLLYTQIDTFSKACLAENSMNEAYSYGTSREVANDTAAQLAACK